MAGCTNLREAAANESHCLLQVSSASDDFGASIFDMMGSVRIARTLPIITARVWGVVSRTCGRVMLRTLRSWAGYSGTCRPRARVRDIRMAHCSGSISPIGACHRTANSSTAATHHPQRYYAVGGSDASWRGEPSLLGCGSRFLHAGACALCRRFESPLDTGHR